MEFLKTGGLSFTLPILFMGIASILLFIWQISKKLSGKELNIKMVDFILFLGSFSLFFGIFGQILGLYNAAEAIQQAGDIAPSLIWGGIKVSLVTIIMGLVVLLFSSIFWFLLKPSRK